MIAATVVAKKHGIAVNYQEEEEPQEQEPIAFEVKGPRFEYYCEADPLEGSIFC
jgi:hypothetical protein